VKTYTKETPIGEITAFANDSFAHQMRSKGYYAEQEILDSHLREIVEGCDMILDIGAHVGYHSVAYCQYNPNAKILCFEPQIEVYKLLLKNIKRNGFNDRITPYNLGVGDKKRITSLVNHISDGGVGNVEYGTNNIHNLGGMQIGEGGEIIDMITVDSLVLNSLDYIKIDVEGAESLVLMGAEDTIKKFKPVIIFEHNHKNISSKFLKSLGYDNIETPFEILKSLGYNNFESIRYENFIAT